MVLAAAVWFHYLQAMKNNTIKVINIIKRQPYCSSSGGREKVFSSRSTFSLSPMA